MLLQRTCSGCPAPAEPRWPLCRTCHRRLAAARLDAVVPPPAGLDGLLALHRYDDDVKRLVLAAKNGGRRPLLELWGRQLGTLAAGTVGGVGTLGGTRGVGPAGGVDAARSAVAVGPAVAVGSAGGPAGFEVVTWVPASRRGARARGYDQGRLLARAVAAVTGIGHRRLLVRSPGQAQAGSDRSHRLAGPTLRAPVASSNRVVLVDDVSTTGGSLTAAARALRRAGAEHVVGLVVAVVVEDR